VAAVPSLSCPSCGADYPVGVVSCAVCRVALVASGAGERAAAARPVDWVPVGSWPRLSAQILRARLETAGVDVLGAADGGAEGLVTLAVPTDQAEFARAVVHELDVDDEVPDTSPVAYVTRIEEHLAAVVELLDELRTRLDELEGHAGG
jgi:hypothetical protein